MKVREGSLAKQGELDESGSLMGFRMNGKLLGQMSEGEAGGVIGGQRGDAEGFGEHGGAILRHDGSGQKSKMRHPLDAGKGGSRQLG